MKRFVVFFLIAILCILLGLWSPWLKLNINLKPFLGLKDPEKISGLQVFSISGEVEVYVNSEQEGTVNPESSPLIVDRIKPGENLIKIERSEDLKAKYWKFDKIVNFEAGTDVVVSYDVGPTEEFSEGHIIYAIQKAQKDQITQLNVSTNVDDAFVQVDNLPPTKVVDKKLSQGITLDTRHKITVSKKGFETLEFTILPEKQEDRDVFKNLDLNVEVQLMYQPVEVE